LTKTNPGKWGSLKQHLREKITPVEKEKSERQEGGSRNRNSLFTSGNLTAGWSAEGQEGKATSTGITELAEGSIGGGVERDRSHKSESTRSRCDSKVGHVPTTFRFILIIPDSSDLQPY